MKELSIEQKAKRYDEALQRAKHALDCDKNGLVNTDKPLIMSIFPELKESEDERIRKSIHIYLDWLDGRKDYAPKGEYSIKDMIAWLEKQSEQKPTLRERYDNIAKSEWFKKTHEGMSISDENVDDTNYCFDCINCENGELKATEDERIRKRIIHALHGDVLDIEETNKALAWIEKQVPIDEEKVQIGARKDVALSIMNFLDRNTLSMCLSNMECEDIENAVVDSNWSKVYNYMKKKLETQGEQKSLLEMKSPEESLGISTKEYNEVVNDCLYSESEIANDCLYVESKSADKTKPKFKVGDWITNGDYTWKIIEVKPLDYMIQAQDGNIIDDTISYVDAQFHYFTSKDAKDGDVLVDKDDNIGIFQECLGLCWHSYFYLGCDGQLYGLGIGGSHEQINTNACPATKEQRDLLFQKMKEAGYEWDDENKKLNKIEPKAEPKNNVIFCLKQWLMHAMSSIMI